MAAVAVEVAGNMTFSELNVQLDNQLKKLQGEVSLKVTFINSNESFNYHEQTQLWAASVIKVALATVIYQQAELGKFSLNDRTALSDENKVLGSGVLKLLDKDTQFTYKDLIILMLTLSDNSATNQLIDLVGWENVEPYLLDQGLANTTFRHKMMIAAGRGPNLTTSNDMATLLLKMYRNELPGSAEILETMTEQIDRTRITRYIPNSIKTACKFGALPEAVHEIGIVYSKNPFVFCFLSDDQKDKSLAMDVLASCAKLCFEYSEEK